MERYSYGGNNRSRIFQRARRWPARNKIKKIEGQREEQVGRWGEEEKERGRKKRWKKRRKREKREISMRTKVANYFPAITGVPFTLSLASRAVRAHVSRCADDSFGR